MRLMFYLSKFLFFSNINATPFKIVHLGRYTPMETLFPLLLAALEVFNRYGVQVDSRHFHNFKCELILERGPPSLVREIG